MGVKILNHASLDLHLTSLRKKSSKHVPFFLPPKFWTWSWGFFSHHFTMYSEASRFRINTTVGYGTNIMLRTKRKSFLEKEHRRFWNCASNWETWPRMARPDVKAPQKAQPFPREASIFCTFVSPFQSTIKKPLEE